MHRLPFLQYTFFFPPIIYNWLSNHPNRINPNGFLFWGIEMNNYKKMFSHDATRKMIFEGSKGSTLKIYISASCFFILVMISTGLGSITRSTAR
jgi:hypothetical protein